MQPLKDLVADHAKWTEDVSPSAPHHSTPAGADANQHYLICGDRFVTLRPRGRKTSASANQALGFQVHGEKFAAELEAVRADRVRYSVRDVPLRAVI